MHRSFRFSPPNQSAVFVVIPLIVIALALMFIAFGAWSRQRTFDGIQSVLTPVPPLDIQSLREALRPWTTSETTYSADESPAESGAHFRFERSSKLSLNVQYNVETGAIRNTNLSYFRDGAVDIKTGRGLVFPLGLTYPIGLAAAATCLSIAVLWYRYHSTIPRKTHLALTILWQLSFLLVGTLLLTITGNYFFF